MLAQSPSGASYPYYYKGGYLKGMHYGGYFDDMDSLRDMMAREEAFMMRSPQKERVLIDLYETRLTEPMLAEFARHIGRLSSRIAKLSIAADWRCRRAVKKALLKRNAIRAQQLHLCADMEEGKAWLVGDGF